MAENYTDLGGIFGESIDEGFSQAVVELIKSTRVAVRNEHVVISNGEDALLTDISIEDIHAEFGLSHRNGVLYGLPQQDVELHWPVLENCSARQLRVCALSR